MSVPERTLPDHFAHAVTNPIPTASDPVGRLVRAAVLPFQFVAFWTAVLLPFAYLPLMATGFASASPLRFAFLLVVNALAFVVGHAYGRPSRVADPVPT